MHLGDLVGGGHGGRCRCPDRVQYATTSVAPTIAASGSRAAQLPLDHGEGHVGFAAPPSGLADADGMARSPAASPASVLCAPPILAESVVTPRALDMAEDHRRGPGLGQHPAAEMSPVIGAAGGLVARLAADGDGPAPPSPAAIRSIRVAGGQNDNIDGGRGKARHRPSRPHQQHAPFPCIFQFPRQVCGAIGGSVLSRKRAPDTRRGQRE